MPESSAHGPVFQSGLRAPKFRQLGILPVVTEPCTHNKNFISPCTQYDRRCANQNFPPVPCEPEKRWPVPFAGGYSHATDNHARHRQKSHHRSTRLRCQSGEPLSMGHMRYRRGIAAGRAWPAIFGIKSAGGRPSCVCVAKPLGLGFTYRPIPSIGTNINSKNPDHRRMRCRYAHAYGPVNPTRNSGCSITCDMAQIIQDLPADQQSSCKTAARHRFESGNQKLEFALLFGGKLIEKPRAKLRWDPTGPGLR